MKDIDDINDKFDTGSLVTPPEKPTEKFKWTPISGPAADAVKKREEAAVSMAQDQAQVRQVLADLKTQFGGVSARQPVRAAPGKRFLPPDVINRAQQPGAPRA